MSERRREEPDLGIHSMTLLSWQEQTEMEAGRPVRRLRVSQVTVVCLGVEKLEHLLEQSSLLNRQSCMVPRNAFQKLETKKFTPGAGAIA